MGTRPKILELDLRSGVLALRRARSAIRTWLGADADVELTGVVELLTTELLTNAIEHGRGATEARLVLLEEAVRVEVADRNPASPHVRDATSTSSGGYGLRLVAALSRAWGAESRAGGKVTWCEVVRVGR